MAKVKICGITNIEDAEFICNLGVDYIGYIFYPKSPRYIEPELAKNLSAIAHKNNVKTIGVFVNESADKINKIAEIAQLDLVQLHGTEPPETLENISLPIIKNIREEADISNYKNCYAFMTDAKDTTEWGGTGKLADWEFAKQIKQSNKTFMLSGGLSINNVDNALKKLNPDIIDISSSVEISAGKKDHRLVKELLEKLNNMEIK